MIFCQKNVPFQTIFFVVSLDGGHTYLSDLDTRAPTHTYTSTRLSFLSPPVWSCFGQTAAQRTLVGPCGGYDKRTVVAVAVFNIFIAQTRLGAAGVCGGVSGICATGRNMHQ